MRIDIYRRAEQNGIFSYLAVPEGKPIPPEATNTDWQAEARALELDEAGGALPDYHITRPLEQIAAKGYAITGAAELARQAGAGI